MKSLYSFKEFIFLILIILIIFESFLLNETSFEVNNNVFDGLLKAAFEVIKA